MRRILIIIGIVLLVGLVVFVGYYLQTRQQAPVGPGDQAVNAGSGQTIPQPRGGGAAGEQGGSGAQIPPTANPGPGAPEVSFGIVSQRLVAGYAVDAQNNIVIVQPDGQIVKIAPGGVETILSSAPIADLATASFSFDSQKALVVSGDQNAQQIAVFDIQTKVWKVLSGQIHSPVWSPDDLRIAFIATDNPQRAVLATLDLKDAKATPRALTEIRAQDMMLSWPNSKSLILSDKSGAYIQGSAWKFDLASRSLVPLITNVRGLSTAWSSNLQYGISFEASPGARGGSFSSLNSSGKVLNRFQVVTLPEKCGFMQTSSTPPTAPSSTAATSTKTTKTAPLPPIWSVVCGFPQNPQAFNLYPEPDTYFERAILTTDYLYSVNLENGVVTNLLPDNSYAFDTSLVSAVRNKVFFVNRIDSKLYALRLP